MGKSYYKRKTDNPNMGWSDERRAEYSAQCKVAHANGTRYKKSKKAVGLAISNGKREAIKRRNRSEGQKKRHAQTIDSVIMIESRPATTISENLLDSAPLPEKDVAVKPKENGKGYYLKTGKIKALFDLIEENFGVRPDLNEFVNSAVEEKLAKVAKALRLN
jgi:hypothetical protein